MRAGLNSLWVVCEEVLYPGAGVFIFLCYVTDFQSQLNRTAQFSAASFHIELLAAQGQRLRAPCP